MKIDIRINPIELELDSSIHTITKQIVEEYIREDISSDNFGKLLVNKLSPVYSVQDFSSAVENVFVNLCGVAVLEARQRSNETLIIRMFLHVSLDFWWYECFVYEGLPSEVHINTLIEY